MTYREVIEKVAALLVENGMDDYGMQSPGKFEGESIATIYAYDADPDDIEFSETSEELDKLFGGDMVTLLMRIAETREQEEIKFPAHPREIEFEPHEQAILRVKRFGYLTEDSNGFVHLSEFAKQQKVCYFIDGSGCIASEFRPVKTRDL